MKKNIYLYIAILAGILLGCTSDEGNKCENGEVFCRNRCIDPMTTKRFCGADEACENFQKCGSDQYCVRGECSDEPDQTCPQGYLICGEECFNPDALNLSKCNTCKRNYEDCNDDMSDGCETHLRTSRTDCGSCGNTCGAGQSCHNGKCQKGCQSNEILCDDICLSRNQNHVESCEECQTSYGNCNGDFSDGCETDFNNDPTNCGVCGNTCPEGKDCANGVCEAACNMTEQRCDGVCVNLSEINMNSCTKCTLNYLNCDLLIENGCEVNRLTDPNNCGTCHNACGVDQRCVKGKCVDGCAEGETSCQEMGVYVCVDTTSNIYHCGGCNRYCKPEKNSVQLGCFSGVCSYECFSNKVNCGTNKNPTCVDFQNDPDHCGGCYNSCQSPGVKQNTCTNGKCSIGVCNENFADCNEILDDGCETNLMSNKNHCGACNNKCPELDYCSNGVCTSSCESPFIECAAANSSVQCIDPSSDAHNCGECNHECVAKPHAIAQCTNSACTYVCETGYQNCGTPEDPLCVDVKSDTANCGSCNNACTNTLPGIETGTCENGLCKALTCKSGYADCNNDPLDGCESNLNLDTQTCGSCKNVCEGTQAACLEGKCCNRKCEGLECGDDGCGGTCGSCTNGGQCEEGKCVFSANYIGCSDGTREGFKSINTHPMIAGCSGAWSIPGLHQAGPHCDRKSGNTGENPKGTDCNVEDLCAEGWHVCLGRDDVKGRTINGCDNIIEENDAPYFFAARTSSSGSFNCTPDTVGSSTENTNDFFGCGNMGCNVSNDTCTPLNMASHDLCIGIVDLECTWKTENGKIKGSGPMGCNWCKPLDYWNYVLNTDYTTAWHCGNQTDNEANNVTKTDPSQGGVLCCKNQCNEDKDCPSGTHCEYNVCK